MARHVHLAGGEGVAARTYRLTPARLHAYRYLREGHLMRTLSTLTSLDQLREHVRELRDNGAHVAS